MSSRTKYNQYILNETLDLLKYDDPNGLIKALSNTCYLVEQAVKTNLRDKNTLLYFDNRSLNNPQAKIAAFLDLPSCTIPSIDLMDAIEIFKELNPQCRKLSQIFDDLRLARNNIVHSTNGTIETPFLYGDITAKLLIELMQFIKKACDLEYANVIVVTRKDLIKRQKELLAKAKKELKDKITQSQLIYRKLKADEIKKRFNSEKNFNNTETFVSSTDPLLCPACGEKSLDEISIVDFDRGDDGEIFSCGTSFYQCRICEIELNQYEFELSGN